MQNKLIRFCLRFDKVQYISLTEFKLMNWLPTKERVHQRINALTFKFVSNNSPFYLNEIFESVEHCRTDTRNSFKKLNTRLKRGRKQSTGTH